MNGEARWTRDEIRLARKIRPHLKVLWKAYAAAQHGAPDRYLATIAAMESRQVIAPMLATPEGFEAASYLVMREGSTGVWQELMGDREWPAWMKNPGW